MTENERKEIEKDEQEQAEPKKVEKTAEEKREDCIAWLRFILIHVLVLIPAAIGIALITVGNKSNNDTMLLAGKIVAFGGVPGVMLILVIVVLTWKIRGIMKMKNEEALSQSEHEQEMIANVNNTHGFESRANMANYEVNHIAEGMKNAPKWGLPVGIGIFLLFVADVVVATMLGIKGIFVGTIICMVLFVVACVIGLIFMSVTRAKSMNGDIRKAKKIVESKVKSCFMVGTTTTKSGGLPHGNGGTVRMQNITYKVIVIAEGVEYGAFSKRFYETGAKVTVAVMGKNKAKIVEDSESEKIETE